MPDRRQTARPGQPDRRKPGNQFGRGEGAFAETVNRTFAILRKQAENSIIPKDEQEG